MNKCTCKTSRRVLVGRIRDILKMSSMRISCARCSDVLCTTEKKSACFFHRKKVTTFCFLGIEKYDKYLLKNQNCNSNPLLCFYAHKLFLRIQLIAKQKRLKPKINWLKQEQLGYFWCHKALPLCHTPLDWLLGSSIPPSNLSSKNSLKKLKIISN